jgi:hypothetical protein
VLLVVRLAGQFGRDLEQDGQRLPTDHERSNGVEGDDELAPVELDGPGRDLHDVDEPRDLLELPTGAVPKRRDVPEVVEVSVACHAETVRKRNAGIIGRAAISPFDQGWRCRSDHGAMPPAGLLPRLSRA